MKHPLYYELASLCHERSTIPNPQGAMNAIEIAFTPELPDDFRKQMRDKTQHFIMPEKPDGMEYGKDCFWRFFQQKFVWHHLWCGTDAGKQRAADFLKKHREAAQKHGSAWPPAPTFRPATTVPMPRDGRDGANGWMPRTGK